MSNRSTKIDKCGPLHPTLSSQQQPCEVAQKKELLDQGHPGRPQPLQCYNLYTKNNNLVSNGRGVLVHVRSVCNEVLYMLSFVTYLKLIYSEGKKKILFIDCFLCEGLHIAIKIYRKIHIFYTF